jgi:hypothetical protein
MVGHAADGGRSIGLDRHPLADALEVLLGADGGLVARLVVHDGVWSWQAMAGIPPSISGKFAARMRFGS